MDKKFLGTCPQKKLEIVNQCFMEHRAKLIDIAAYLDRLDRGSGDLNDDYRHAAFLQALEILSSQQPDQPQRAKRVLELFSDHTREIPQSAAGTKGAAGAAPVNAGGAM